MIQVHQVTKKFGQVTAVNSVSFSVAEEETLVLLGTSGCGKTTTLRMINRLTDPSSGTILVNGKSVSGVVPELLRRSIGYVLQHTGLFPHYTVAENIAVVPKLLHWPASKIRSRITELIHKVHLTEEHLPLYPHQLSGGQQQRVGLARALMANPPVLLLDEPFGALDPITRFKIREEFLQLDELKRKTMVLVTHDVQEAFALGDRICLMHNGQIEQIGTPEELLFRPQTEFVKQFLNDQRLLLELKAIKISEDSETIPGAKILDASLYDTLTMLLQQNNIPVTQERAGNNQKPEYSIKLEALISALQHLRKN